MNLSKLRLSDHPRAAFHHGRIAWDVGSDQRLSDRDVRVYWAMVCTCWDTNIFTLPTRWIAKNTGGEISQTEVIRSQERLESLHKIEALPRRRGQGKSWRILSPIFGVYNTALEGRVVPVEALALARKGKKCGKCKKVAAAIGSSGICGECLQAYSNSRKQA